MAEFLSDFRQGDTKIIKIDYGTGNDITGWDFFFTMRDTFGVDSVIVAQVKTTAGDHTLDDVANGLAHLELDSESSALIPAGGYVYDVQRVKPNGAKPVSVLTLIPTVEKFDDILTVAPQVTVIVDAV